MTLVYQLSMCWFILFDDIIVAYQVLFTNTCVVQLSLAALLDAFFLMKLVKWSQNSHHVSRMNPSENKQISSTVTLLVLQIFSFLSALPCGIGLLLTISLDPTSNDLPVGFVRLLRIILNIGWILIFTQSSLNIFLYFARINKFRHVIMKMSASQLNRISGTSTQYSGS
ncbi:unnamed protein product [Heterobilharzia americana]|nr:unnamed protein product [Heterobilharzia americana]